MLKFSGLTTQQNHLMSGTTQMGQVRIFVGGASLVLEGWVNAEKHWGTPRVEHKYNKQPSVTCFLDWFSIKHLRKKTGITIATKVSKMKTS